MMDEIRQEIQDGIRDDFHANREYILFLYKEVQRLEAWKERAKRGFARYETDLGKWCEMYLHSVFARSKLEDEIERLSSKPYFRE